MAKKDARLTELTFKGETIPRDDTPIGQLIQGEFEENKLRRQMQASGINLPTQPEGIVEAWYRNEEGECELDCNKCEDDECVPCQYCRACLSILHFFVCMPAYFMCCFCFCINDRDFMACTSCGCTHCGSKTVTSVPPLPLPRSCVPLL